MDETADERARSALREMEARVAAQREHLAALEREQFDLGAIVSATDLLDGMEYALSLLQRSMAADAGGTHN